MSVACDPQVSFDEELLILVDANDNIRGYENKRNTHQGDGLLHRAFSIFIFSPPDRVLLHKRSQSKPLWPLFWTNSCCSHPRKGESSLSAAYRRLREELGIFTELTFLYKFQYAASFRDKGAERELCSVYGGWVETDCRIDPNSNEIAEWQWVSCSAVDEWIEKSPEHFTPWFLREWATVRRHKGPAAYLPRREHRNSYAKI